VDDVAAAKGRLAVKPLVIGAGGGLLSGIVGGGGGAIMVPLMTGLMAMPQHTAHGTSLVVIVATALAAALIYALEAAIDWTLVATLLTGSTAGAYLGARLSQHIPALRLRQLFGLFLVIIAARLLFFREIDPIFDARGSGEIIVGTLIGLFGGLTSGALGVGGGAVFVPALVLLLGAGQHEAQGMSLWVVVWSALVGSLTHYRLGTVDVRAARLIAPAAVPAGIAGALIAAQLDTGQLQALFAVILTLLGGQIALTSTQALLRLRRDEYGPETDPERF
jgi:uncharacterized membrane protein YfcA